MHKMAQKTRKKNKGLLESLTTAQVVKTSVIVNNSNAFFFQVAALDDSPEYYLAVRRNARVNKGETLEDVNTTTIKLKT